MDNCAINADFILCKGKTYVLEIGARAGATCLVEMTSLYYGFDYYEKIIQCNLGEKPDFTPQAAPQPNAEMLFQAPVTGKITDIDLSGVTPDERIINLSMDYQVGDAVRQFRKGPDSIGQIIAIGDNVPQAKELIDRAMAQVKITIDPE